MSMNVFTIIIIFMTKMKFLSEYSINLFCLFLICIYVLYNECSYTVALSCLVFVLINRKEDNIFFSDQ